MLRGGQFLCWAGVLAAGSCAFLQNCLFPSLLENTRFALCGTKSPCALNLPVGWKPGYVLKRVSLPSLEGQRYIGKCALLEIGFNFPLSTF